MEIITKILNVEYDDYLETFILEFATHDDKDEFFRLQKMDKDTFLTYYPDIINLKRWKKELDNESVVYMLETYYEDFEDEFPDRQLL